MNSSDFPSEYQYQRYCRDIIMSKNMIHPIRNSDLDLFGIPYKTDETIAEYFVDFDTLNTKYPISNFVRGDYIVFTSIYDTARRGMVALFDGSKVIPIGDYGTYGCIPAEMNVLTEFSPEKFDIYFRDIEIDISKLTLSGEGIIANAVGNLFRYTSVQFMDKVYSIFHQIPNINCQQFWDELRTTRVFTTAAGDAGDSYGTPAAEGDLLFGELSKNNPN